MPSFRDERWVTKFHLPYNCWDDLIFVSLWNIQRYPTHLDVGKGQRSMCCWRMLPFGIIQDHPRPFVTNEVFTGAVDQVDLYRAADATEWVNEMLGDSSCALLDLGVRFPGLFFLYWYHVIVSLKVIFRLVKGVLDIICLMLLNCFIFIYIYIQMVEWVWWVYVLDTDISISYHNPYISVHDVASQNSLEESQYQVLIPGVQ